MFNLFMPGDSVRYIGTKLSRDINSKIGVIVSYIQNEKDTIVVEFDGSSYIVHSSSLKKHKFNSSNKDSFKTKN